jgi:hypothetical protein
MSTTPGRQAALQLTRRGVVLTLVAASALLTWFAVAGAARALAEDDPLAGGSTQLDLQKGLRAALRARGVKLVARKPASANSKAGTARLPVGGGGMNPTTGTGRIVHRGRLGFRRGRRHLFIRSVTLDTRRGLITAKVGHGKMKVAFARRIGYANRQSDLGADVTVGSLRLTAPFAKRLNARLGVGTFRSFRRVATSSSTIRPASMKVVPVSPPPGNLRSGYLFLKPERSALAKLESKGITYFEWPCEMESCAASTMGPLSPANFIGAGPPSMYFPITGGRISPDASSGTVETAGGIRIATNDLLSTNPAVVVLTDIWIELDAGLVTANAEFQPSPPAPGNIGRMAIADLDVSDASGGSGYVRSSVHSSGGTLKLTQTMASVLNHTFPGPATGDFMSGDALAGLTFDAETRWQWQPPEP